jgi:hypothetical protein
MASLDWQVRRRIELSSRRGVALEDPTHAALAAERAHQSIRSLYWGLVCGPIAAALVWMGTTSGSTVILVFAALAALLFAVIVARLVIHHRARARHLATADFDGIRQIALTHRTTYRRRD